MSDPDSEVVVQTPPHRRSSAVRIGLEKTAAGRFLTLQPLGQRLDSFRTQVRITATAGEVRDYAILRHPSTPGIHSRGRTCPRTAMDLHLPVAQRRSIHRHDGRTSIETGIPTPCFRTPSGGDQPQYRGFSSSVAIGRSSDQDCGTTWMDAGRGRLSGSIRRRTGRIRHRHPNHPPNNPSIPLSVGSLVPLNIWRRHMGRCERGWQARPDLFGNHEHLPPCRDRPPR